jgi:putative FmdB family regulatory protein
VPTYSYACTACEHHFDTVQTFTDASLTDCPECSGRLRKLFSSVGIVFKGSGFYRTDSRTSRSDKPGSNDKNDKSESGAKDKSDSKKSDAGSSSDSKIGSGSASSTASASATSSTS